MFWKKAPYCLNETFIGNSKHLTGFVKKLCIMRFAEFCGSYAGVLFKGSGKLALVCKTADQRDFDKRFSRINK